MHESDLDPMQLQEKFLDEDQDDEILEENLDENKENLKEEPLLLLEEVETDL